MSFHVAPLIRSMEEARVAVGLLSALDSVAWVEVTAQEAAGTRPTPKITPDGGLGNFWFANQKTTPTI